MSDLTEETIDRLIDLGVTAEKARIATLSDGKTILLNIGDDKEFTELTPATKDAFGLALDLPDHIKRSITVQTAGSLIDYIARFKENGTTLFADIASNRIVAVLDYHLDANTADRLDHVATLVLPLSEEWKTWQAAHDKLMDQLTFSRFIEENGVDIESPDAADILECAKDLFAVRKADFRNAVRTNTNAVKFEYSESEDLKSASSVEVPKQFVLRLPVYFGGDSTELRANLRWNPDRERGLQLGVSLSRAEYVRQAMFKQVVEQIAAAADVPAIYGSPGSL